MKEAEFGNTPVKYTHKHQDYHNEAGLALMNMHDTQRILNELNTHNKRDMNMYEHTNISARM